MSYNDYPGCSDSYDSNESPEQTALDAAYAERARVQSELDALCAEPSPWYVLGVYHADAQQATTVRGLATDKRMRHIERLDVRIAALLLDINGEFPEDCGGFDPDAVIDAEFHALACVVCGADLGNGDDPRRDGDCRECLSRAYAADEAATDARNDEGMSDAEFDAAVREDGDRAYAACEKRGHHAWTWTYDSGPARHCDDCGISESEFHARKADEMRADTYDYVADDFNFDANRERA